MFLGGLIVGLLAGVILTLLLVGLCVAAADEAYRLGEHRQ